MINSSDVVGKHQHHQPYNHASVDLQLGDGPVPAPYTGQLSTVYIILVYMHSHIANTCQYTTMSHIICAWTIHEQRLDYTRYSTCLCRGVVWLCDSLSTTNWPAGLLSKPWLLDGGQRQEETAWTRIGINKEEIYINFMKVPRLGGKQWPNIVYDVFSMYKVPWEEQLQKNLEFDESLRSDDSRSAGQLLFFQSGQPTRSASRWP